MSAVPVEKSRLDYALEYAAMGWHVLPVHYIMENGECSCGNPNCLPKNRGKHPATLQGVKNATTNPDIIKDWFRKPYNIGVAAGMGISGFQVVDIDPRNGGDETWAALAKQHGAPSETVVAQTGGGGEHYLYSIPEDKELIKFGPGIDVKKDGGYIVVEPSNHFSGGEYYWDGAFSPLDGVAIMPAPDWMLRDKGERAELEESWEESDYLTPSIVKDLRSALCYLDPDPYEAYFEVLAALKGSGNTTQTKGLAMEWAQGSSKFEMPEFNKTWGSISVEGNQSGRLTYTSIFKWAEQNGWVNTIHGHITPALSDPLPVKTVSTPAKAPSANYMTIPGVLGDVVKWIDETSRKPQPLFSVQAALAFGATLLGRKYVTPNKNWSNLYFLNIGKSASGKEHAKWAIERLLQAAELEHLIGPGKYSSESGVLSALIAQPCHIATVDEFGKFLESSNANGNFMAKDSVKALIEVWGRSEGLMRAIGYSTFGMSGNQIEEMKSRFVYNPNLSMLAMGTPESFFDAVSSKGVRDGFLNRFLIAHTDIGRQPGRMLDGVPDVPVHISEWASEVRLADRIGNLAQMEESHSIEPQPIVIPFSDPAKDRFKEFEVECLKRMDELEEIGLTEMYGRCNEMAMRLSLIVAVSCESRVINDEHATWAINYVKTVQEVNVYHLRDRLADSPFAAMKNDVYRAVLESRERGLTHRELARKVYCYRAAKPKLQEEVVQSLIKDQEIQLQQIQTKGRARSAWVAIDSD